MRIGGRRPSHDHCAGEEGNASGKKMHYDFSINIHLKTWVRHAFSEFLWSKVPCQMLTCQFPEEKCRWRIMHCSIFSDRLKLVEFQKLLRVEASTFHHGIFPQVPVSKRAIPHKICPNHPWGMCKEVHVPNGFQLQMQFSETMDSFSHV